MSAPPAVMDRAGLEALAAWCRQVRDAALAEQETAAGRAARFAEPGADRAAATAFAGVAGSAGHLGAWAMMAASALERGSGT